MPVMDLWWDYFFIFLLILVRVASFWVILPVMTQQVPVLTKVGLAAVLSLLMIPLAKEYAIPDNAAGLIMVILTEILVGLTIGFGVNLTFSAVYIAGQLIDIPMGFGMAGVFDPVSGMAVPLITQFHRVLSVLMFFTVNGHHALIYNISRSFDLIPIGKPIFDGNLPTLLLEGLAEVFYLGLRIAFPFIAAIFLADVALGIASRAVPQINALIMGFPIKILLGFIVYFLYIPIFIGILMQLFGNYGLFNQLMRSTIERLGGY
jgi:flagellar biosynthetic protein FliR